MAKITNVKEVAVSTLKPYERNAKTHSPEQVKKIAASIKEFGFISPCLIDKDYNILAGHGRVLAAQELGLEFVPCVFIEGLTETQRKAYVIADNKLSELGGWDFELLDMELADIALEGFDLDIILENDEPVEASPEPNKERAGIDLPQSSYNLIIECADEQEMRSTFDWLNANGIQCKVSTL